MNQRIVIIEDDFTAADVIADFLMDEGYTLEVADTVEEAEKVVEPGDILVVDVRIGAQQSAGVDFVISLRKKRSEFAKTKTIFISNFGRRGEIEGLLKQLNGPYRWLDKPVDMNELLIEIKNGQEK